MCNSVQQIESTVYEVLSVSRRQRVGKGLEVLKRERDLVRKEKREDRGKI